MNIRGLTYIPNYISSETAENLLREIESLPWCNDLKRRVQHYGYKYDYTKRSINQDMKVNEIPKECFKLARKLVEDKIFVHTPDQLIVNEYLRGQGIAPHTDCVPCFKDTIVSISLISPIVMNFSRYQHKFDLDLEKNSCLIVKDEARYLWKHGIEPKIKDGDRVRDLRISLTFREVILA